MSRDYIDFISAYCDGWCERCAFTQRCSHFAVTAAIAMCDGDFSAALELAVGPACTPGRTPPRTIEECIDEVLGDYEPPQKELDDIGHEIDERHRRIRFHPLAESSMDYAVAAHRWLEAQQRCTSRFDPYVRDCFDVVGRDSYLIHVKIMRALNGLDEYSGEASFEADAVQNDWNGSAKVALLSIGRSEIAWRAIASATGDEAAAILADSLRRLAQKMGDQFPRANDFRRPGFDDRQR